MAADELATESRARCWEWLLEVNPRLPRCRLLLQLRARASPEVPSHLEWSARASASGGRLRLQLEPAQADSAGGQRRADSLDLWCGDGLEVTPDSLQSHHDHLCVTLGLRSESLWLAELLKPIRAEKEQEVQDLRCRRCGEALLLPGAGPAQLLLLPTTMWEACLDSVACEECAPLGFTHVAPARGRIYLSPQCLLVSAADLRANAYHIGTDGLVRCSCRSVIGEAQSNAASAASAPGAARAPDQDRGRSALRRRLFCQEAWGRGGACRQRGISLYKHRVSMPVPAEDRTVETEDALAEVTEAAAVGAHLMSLRISDGHSRFILLPGPPGEEDEDCGLEILSGSAGQGVAEALELRLVVPELVLLSSPRQTPNTAPVRGSLAVQRVAKVYYRRRPCTAPAADCHVLVAPPVSFAALCGALDGWAAALPASHVQAPLSTKDGLGTWATSFLPLPPRDSALE